MKQYIFRMAKHPDVHGRIKLAYFTASKLGDIWLVKTGISSIVRNDISYFRVAIVNGKYQRQREFRSKKEVQCSLAKWRRAVERKYGYKKENKFYVG